MTEQIREDIYLIKVPLPGNPLKNLNCYLIKGKNRNLLIDTGFHARKCLEALKNGLCQLNIDMEQTDIFLTHMHADHAGCASLIASKESRIFISSIDQKGLHKYFDPDCRKLIYQKYLTLGFHENELIEVFQKPGWQKPLGEEPAACHGLEDGDTLDLGKYRFTCMLTSGHTPGHMCLYEKDRQILFCGDHVLYDITPNITGWLEMENALGKYLFNLEKMKTLPVESAFCSHRTPLGNFPARLEGLIRHHQDRLEETLDIIRAFPCATPYFAASQMNWSIRAESWEFFPVEQKMFAVGEADSHLEYLYYAGLLKRENRRGVWEYYDTGFAEGLGKG